MYRWNWNCLQFPFFPICKVVQFVRTSSWISSHSLRSISSSSWSSTAEQHFQHFRIFNSFLIWNSRILYIYCEFIFRPRLVHVAFGYQRLSTWWSWTKSRFENHWNLAMPSPIANWSSVEVENSQISDFVSWTCISSTQGTTTCQDSISKSTNCIVNFIRFHLLFSDSHNSDDYLTQTLYF